VNTCQIPPNVQTEEPLLAGCPRCYPPHLEAVSSFRNLSVRQGFVIHLTKSGAIYYLHHLNYISDPVYHSPLWENVLSMLRLQQNTPIYNPFTTAHEKFTPTADAPLSPVLTSIIYLYHVYNEDAGCMYM
jgi:hypothetical protein